MYYIYYIVDSSDVTCGSLYSYSGQVEHREQDGSVSIHVPCSNGKGLNAEADAGIAVEKLPNGDTVFLLPNGERELHTKEYMVSILKNKESRCVAWKLSQHILEKN